LRSRFSSLDLARSVLAVGIIGASVATPRSACAASQESGRYHFGSSADGSTFVLDSASGRVWRYDRADDAWYLYDLEALVTMPREKGAKSRGVTPTPAPQESQPESEPPHEPEGDPRQNGR